MLEVKNLSFHIGNFDINDVSFSINEGEYFVLLGPPGSGKTLIAECITGLKKADSGNILLNNNDITYSKPNEREIGYVPQDYALIPFLTVYENIRFGKRAKRLPENEIKDLMEMLQIAHLADRFPETLSGGEKQKVALGRALAIKPKMLILDEPVSALDENTRENLCLELKRIQKQMGYTVYHISHIFEETLILADKIGIISKGKLIQAGRPDEIFRDPKDAFIAEFTRSKNIIPLDLLSEITGKEYAGSAAGKAVIRPEDIIILKPGEQTGNDNQVRCKVTEIFPRYPLTWINLDCGVNLWGVLLSRDLEKYSLDLGSKVSIILPGDKIKTLN